jgi:hypothetical protein
MNTFLYDFNKGKSIDPLQGVTHFYVNPYQLADSWKTLNLGNKVDGIDIELVIQESTGLPVIIIPIKVLNLGRCMIKLNEDFSGKISTGKQSIYFKPTEQDHIICINSVC